MKGEISLAAMKKIAIHALYRRVFENVHNTSYSKNCLLIYVATAYLKIPIISRYMRAPTHQNIWQTKEIARIMSKLGYNVDVADYSVKGITLHRKYDVVIDIHPQELPIYENYLNYGAKKIAFITGPNPVFSNTEERKRLEQLFKRKGVRLRARRYIQPMPSVLSHFDALLFVGNAYNLHQYDSFPIPKKYCIPNYGYVSLAPITYKKKNSDAFLFLGSSGLVFRGLDLLLETFSHMPEKHLYVCASLEEEQDFANVYKNELFSTPNIHIVGFVGLESQEYRDLCDMCSYMILPSCAEGMSGSVLVAMSAGVIPLVMRESGVDGLHYFKDTSTEGLQRVVEMYSKKPMRWIISESKEMLSILQKKYTKECFTLELERALKHILN